MGFLDRLRSGGDAGSAEGASANKLWDSLFKLIMKKDMDGALSTLERLVALEPANPQVYLKKAEILQRTNDIDGAVAAYFKATVNLEGGESGHKAHAIYKIILRLRPGDAKAKKLLSTPPVATPVYDELPGGDGSAVYQSHAQPVSPTPEHPSAQEDLHPEGADSYSEAPDSYAGNGGIELAALGEEDIGLEGDSEENDTEDSEYTSGLMPDGDAANALTGSEEMPDSMEGIGTGETEQPSGSSSDAMDWGDLAAGAARTETDMGAEQSLSASEPSAGSSSDAGDALNWDDMNAGDGGASVESSLDMLAGDVGVGDEKGDDSPAGDISFSLMGQPEKGAQGGSPELPEESTGRIAQVDSSLWGDEGTSAKDSLLSDKQVDTDTVNEMEGEYADLSGGIELQSLEVEPDAGSLEPPALPEVMPDEVFMDTSAGQELDDEVELQETSLDDTDSKSEVVEDIDSSLWEPPAEDSPSDMGLKVDAAAVSVEGSVDEEVEFVPEDAEDEALPPIFSFLSVEDIESLPEKASHRSYSEGDLVIREGDSSDSMFIIKSGSARVETSIRDKQVRLGTLIQGDFFGEVAFLTGKPRTASVIAEGELEVMEIDRALLQSTVENNPLVLDSLLDMYKNRALDAVKRIRESS